MGSINKKDYINSVYNGFLIGLVSIGLSGVVTKFTKQNVGFTSLTLTNTLKGAAVITSGTVLVHVLEDKKILP